MLGMKARALSTVKRVVVAQLGITIALALALIFYGRTAAYSALLGGSIYTIANAYAGWRIFSRKRNDSVHGELYNFYRAEFGKLLMIGALCAATFASIKAINVIAFVGGCVAAMIAGVVGASFEQANYAPPKQK
jgi:F0F1-type ATP synthase assembly protein I